MAVEEVGVVESVGVGGRRHVVLETEFYRFCTVSMPKELQECCSWSPEVSTVWVVVGDFSFTRYRVTLPSVMNCRDLN